MSTTNSETVHKYQRRPGKSAIKQQRLRAWQPILTARSVLPVFFLIGIVFIQIGVALYIINLGKELTIDYTNCVGNGTETCSDVLSFHWNNSCECNITFTLDEDWKGEVYMYYSLESFYQNHRLFVRSRDDNQLIGKLTADVDHNCYPFDYTEDGVPIAPCGAISNSIFNDTLSLSFKGEQIILLKTGIAFNCRKGTRFKNPPGNLESALDGFEKPPNWQKKLYELDKDNPDNNGFLNEDFMVWMAPAAMSTFRKLYRRIQHGLKAGEYVLDVSFKFPVKLFSGRKKMILATTSFIGSNNPYLTLSFSIVGVIYVLLGALLLFLHIKWRQRNDELVSINPRTGLSRAAHISHVR